MVTGTVSLWLASPQLSRGQGSFSLALATHAGLLPIPLRREALPVGRRRSYPRDPDSEANTLLCIKISSTPDCPASLEIGFSKCCGCHMGSEPRTRVRSSSRSVGGWAGGNGSLPVAMKARAGKQGKFETWEPCFGGQSVAERPPGVKA